MPAITIRPATTKGTLPPYMEQIIGAVGLWLGVTRADLLSRCRQRRVAEARMVLLALAKEFGGRYASFAEIGRTFGVHHGSVMHACDRVSELCSIDPVFAERVRMVRREAATFTAP